MMRIEDWKEDDLSEEQLSVYKEIIKRPRGKVVGLLKFGSIMLSLHHVHKL